MTSRVTARMFGTRRGELVEPVTAARCRDHVEALGRQPPGRRRPDPAARSGDDRNVRACRSIRAASGMIDEAVGTSRMRRGRDAQRAHLPARPARRRRRRRHERLHRRDRPPAGRSAASRSRSSPARPPATSRRSSSCARRARPARDRRAVRGARQGRPARAAVRVHRGRAAHRGVPRAGLVRRRPLALLAVRAGRLAGSASAGACRSCTRRTPSPR